MLYSKGINTLCKTESQQALAEGPATLHLKGSPLTSTPTPPPSSLWCWCCSKLSGTAGAEAPLLSTAVVLKQVLRYDVTEELAVVWVALPSCPLSTELPVEQLRRMKACGCMAARSVGRRHGPCMNCCLTLSLTAPHPQPAAHLERWRFAHNGISASLSLCVSKVPWNGSHLSWPTSVF